MASNSLTILGSASGLPQADRATSGYVLRVNDRLSLIDCGGGVSSSFLKRGFRPLDVDRVFISHTHADHVSDLPLFIQLLHLESRRRPLDLYVPSEFVEPLKLYLPALYLIREKLSFEIIITGYEDGFEYEDDFRLTAVANKHLHGYAEFITRLSLLNRMQCYSFVIEVEGKTLLYSADILEFADIKDHLDGHDCVILETTHIHLEEFFEHAQNIEVGQYVMTHLGTPEEIAEIDASAKKHGITNLATAVDGMEIGL